MKTNIKKPPLQLFKNVIAKAPNAEQELRRCVMSCLLFEKEFYVDGFGIADRIAQLVPAVSPEKVAAIAIEARVVNNLRHIPLLIAWQMTFHETHRSYVKETLAAVVQRPDEMGEYLSMYAAGRKGPKFLNKLSNGSKKGLVLAFTKFNEYQLAKWNQDSAVKLRDVLFLCHPKPNDAAQAALWKRLIDNKLEVPNTWEVMISAAKGDKVGTMAAWSSLISGGQLGAMAFLRNLRNMEQSGIPEDVVRYGLKKLKTGRVLPYRFISAARYAPQYEPELEQLMIENVAEHPKLGGKTVLLVDISGSMNHPMSAKSEMTRMDAALGLAVLVREIGEEVLVYSFSKDTIRIPARKGFALRDAIKNSQKHGSTYLGQALRDVAPQIGPKDRLIVISDEQSNDTVGEPNFERAYMINVASNSRGVSYGKWKHVDGFSESVITWIQELEKE